MQLKIMNSVDNKETLFIDPYRLPIMHLSVPIYFELSVSTDLQS